MKQEPINYRNIYYPPGGILMWIIVFLELITFGMAVVAMVYCGKQEPEIFHESRLLLNPVYGIINTILLITSGFCMAISVHYLKINTLQKSKVLLLATMLFGMLFLIVKTFEYNEKINLGLDINHDLFFTFYWLLTLFHVIHVIVGLVILGSVYFGLRKEKTNIEDVEASATFWHMCDLIWLLIFPVIYLFF
ncbi:cytochrome c oxidase subunit 3 [Aquimarina sp. Aq78]|uniref:cytochrome c oxidase subunit 3 n=1 Tax=Aquimarina sp. Aq78 TaxID=1191889 RepID=UPI000D0E4317|nr:cytochrome c oxidase subunit 3 [Aquimarina sp. Aq78]